jgi:hypothetical protein
MKSIELFIDTNGNIHALWDDFLSGIPGNKEITRASNVEFSKEVQKWVVTIEIGKYKGCCLPKTFKNRADAISEEIKFFNETLFN